MYASPVATEDKIYVTGRSGNTAVLTPGEKLKIEQINKLGEPIDASPAIVGNEIYLRSRCTLNIKCIGVINGQGIVEKTKVLIE